MNPNFSVLIVGEAINICYLIELFFENFKVSCSSVNSLKSAKAVLKTFTPSLLILDNSLLDKEGIDFIGDLNKEFPEIRVVICIDDYHEVLAEGMDTIKYKTLKKPFILKSIKTILEESSLSHS